MCRFWAWLVISLGSGCVLEAAEHVVGPGREFADPGEVPWEKLAAGDTVLIHWRPEPYRNKWVICRRGEPDKPITVQGVAGPKGELPVIDGDRAVVRRELDYWHEQRSVIKVGGANRPEDTFPAHIVIENLEVRGARQPNTYIGRKGQGTYVDIAAGIFVEKGEDITIRNCTLRDNANGLVVASQSKSVIVEHCWILENGVEGNVYAHNAYTSADGMTFRFNRFGPLRKGCPGNNLKDRSADLLVHCNWIEGGSQQLDLVDAEDRESLRMSPDYQQVVVHGNVLIEHDGDGRDDIVHFGGDSGNVDWYRRGPLRFHHNTVVSFRKGNTTLFRLSGDAQSVDAQNNIFAALGGGTFSIMESSGRVSLVHNWLTEGWQPLEKRGTGRVLAKEGMLTGKEPGFRDALKMDFNLMPGAPCAKGSGTLEGGIINPNLLGEAYHMHQGRRSVSLPKSGGALGAFR